jgi:hypothetical protein
MRLYMLWPALPTPTLRFGPLNQRLGICRLWNRRQRLRITAVVVSSSGIGISFFDIIQRDPSVSKANWL